MPDKNKVAEGPSASPSLDEHSYTEHGANIDLGEAHPKAKSILSKNRKIGNVKSMPTVKGSDLPDRVYRPLGM